MEKKKEKVVDTKLKVQFSHTPLRNRGASEMTQTPPGKPLEDA
jgi:hypothetical protein